jgi:hypothetical protein
MSGLADFLDPLFPLGEYIAAAEMVFEGEIDGS